MNRITSNKLTAAAAFGGALLVGIGVGIAAAPSAAEPEVETITEQVPVTPPECADAIDSANELVDLLADALDVSADAMGAAASLDAAGIDDATDRLDQITPQVGEARIDFDDAAADCIAEEGEA